MTGLHKEAASLSLAHSRLEFNSCRYICDVSVQRLTSTSRLQQAVGLVRSIKSKDKITTKKKTTPKILRSLLLRECKGLEGWANEGGRKELPPLQGLWESGCLLGSRRNGKLNTFSKCQNDRKLLSAREVPPRVINS